MNKNINTKYVRWAVIIGFLFFFGLRGHVYTDFINYYPYFQDLPTIWDGFKFTDYVFDIGFEWYSMIIKSIWDNYFFWVFINTLIDVLILNIIFKRYSKYYVLSFILFILFQGIIIEFNFYRNVKAIMLFLLSLKYLEERKLTKYMILNLIGMSFHISSIIYLPLYFFLHKRFSIKLLIAIFVIGNIIFLFQIQYIEPIFQTLGNIFGGKIQEKIVIYFASEYFSKPYGLSIGYIERFLSYLFVLTYYKKLIQVNKQNILFINGYILYFICFFYFSEATVVTERVSLLFVFSYWILFTNIYSLFYHKNKKYIFIFVLLTYGSLKLIKLNSDIIMKYENLLFEVQSFQSRYLEFNENRKSLKDIQ
ncbi:MAG: EpsG family protein [Chitinophagaceae bacterium]